MVLWIHLLCWILLVVNVAIGLATSDLKKSENWAMVSRVIYVVAIISGILLFVATWKYHVMLSILKVVLALGLIAFIEIAFAQKQKGQLHASLIWWVAIFLVIVGIFGLYLSQGRPFLH